MNILYHHRTQGRGAEGVHISSMVLAMESLGHSVEILSPPGINPQATAGSYLYQKSSLKKEGVIHIFFQFLSRHAPEIVFELAEVVYNILSLARLLGRLRHVPTDLIYERYAFFLWAGAFAARCMRLPLILEVNEISGIARARKQLLLPLARFIESRIFSTADTIVVVSSFLKETLVSRGVDSQKIVVVPNGVDEMKFHPDWGKQTETILHQWGFEGRIIFGFVGWFDPWDKLPFLINIFEEIWRLRPQSALTLVGNVVGKWPTLEDLRADIRRKGLDKAIVLTGAVAREVMPQTIAAFDVGIIPNSNPFGSPVALFEFMSSGKPVIAPSFAPLRDVLQHGENGLLFPPEDRVKLKEAFLYLIDNPTERARIGAAARQSILKEHTWKAKAKQILDFHAQQEERL